MKVSELRIGNLFYTTSDRIGIKIPQNIPFKVLEIEYFLIKGIISTSKAAQIKHWNEFNPNEIAPIKLTHDWLIKFGFETEDCEVDFMEYAFEYEEDSYIYSICNIGGLNDHDKHPFYVEFENAGQRNGWQTNSKIELKYVHQLQNFHFALTGTELSYEG